MLNVKDVPFSYFCKKEYIKNPISVNHYLPHMLSYRCEVIKNIDIINFKFS